MGFQNQRPVRQAGAQIWSGGPNTGEQTTTRGGSATITVFSGGLITLGSGAPVPISNPGTGHAVFVSGAGRLNTVLPHQAISGVSIRFYDSNVAAVSGVAGFAASGWKVLAAVPQNTIGSFGGQLGAGPAPIVYDTPFALGLSVSCASGCPGFSCTYTPEILPASGGLSAQ